MLHAQRVTDRLKNDITFTVEHNGKTFDFSVDAEPLRRYPIRYGFAQNKDEWLDIRTQSETPYYLKHLDKIYYFDHLPESKAVYVRHSQIQDDPSEPIPAFYKRLFEFVEGK